MDAAFRLDGVLSSLAVKAPCKVATNANLTLSGEQTVNSVAVVTNDRVLAKDQDDPIENGIYDVSTAAWNRSPDFDGNRDALNGTLVVVASTPLVGIYQMTGTNPIVIGTSALTFQLLSTIDLAGKLASTATGLGASLVSLEDAGGFLTAEQVEAAFAEIFATPSATKRRLLELATQAEVDAGSDAVRAVTPATLKAATNLEYETGDFTLTFSVGFTTTPTLVIDFTRIGKMVTFAINDTVSATSDTTGMAADAGDVPASLRPVTSTFMLFPIVDNGTQQMGRIKIDSAGNCEFFKGVTPSGAFTGSGTKGTTADPIHVSYMLD